MVPMDLFRGDLLGFPLLHGLQEPQGEQRLLPLGQGLLGRAQKRHRTHVGPEAIIKQQLIAAAQHPEAPAVAVQFFGFGQLCITICAAVPAVGGLAISRRIRLGRW